MHWYYRFIRFVMGDDFLKMVIDYQNGNGRLYLNDPITAIAITTAVVAAGTVGNQAYQSNIQKKSMKSAMEAQQDAVTAAEKKSEAAESLAASTAAEKVKKLRLSQTQTILTTPLGVN